MPVVRVPGVCGGRAHIQGRRLCVWILVSLSEQGADVVELQRHYPHLTDRDIADALVYYLSHWEEIEEDIRVNTEIDVGP